MEYYNKQFCIEVWGDYACFTRPEMKVERVSYDVITPSAARAVFEAIFWKPAIQWKVKKIEVLNPIRWISVRRNEVGKLMSPQSKQIFIEEDRQQRAGLLLRDVAYRIYAEMEFISLRNRNRHDTPDELKDQEEDLEISKELQKHLEDYMLERSNLKRKDLKKIYQLKRDFYISAKQAIEFGIADEII